MFKNIQNVSRMTIQIQIYSNLFRICVGCVDTLTPDMWNLAESCCSAAEMGDWISYSTLDRHPNHQTSIPNKMNSNYFAQIIIRNFRNSLLIIKNIYIYRYIDMFKTWNRIQHRSKQELPVLAPGRPKRWRRSWSPGVRSCRASGWKPTENGGRMSRCFVFGVFGKKTMLYHVTMSAFVAWFLLMFTVHLFLDQGKLRSR